MMHNLLLLDTLCALLLSKSCHIYNFDAAGEESALTAAVLVILAIGIKQLILLEAHKKYV
jgi:hypothetical protein